MIELPTLYNHQASMRDRARESLAKHRRIILCAPPGVGKTRLAKCILGASANREPGLNQSGNCLFAVHRRGLVSNASDSFSEMPVLPHGVIMSGEKPRYGHRVQVASIDTLLSWFIEGGRYETNVTFDLVIFDECHSSNSRLVRFLDQHDRYRAEIGMPPAYLIGLSATPQAKGLADVYKEIVQGPSTQWLIDNGFLSPFRYFRATQGRLDLLVKHGDKFTDESESAAMAGMSGDLVRDWKKYAEGRPTLGFFPRKTHAQEAREMLNAAGLRTEYVDGETDDATRKRIFWELNNYKIDYLCNVQVLERGTDISAIACVQMCVAMRSVVRWRQSIGRGSRIDDGSRENGNHVRPKTDCIILDHGGNLRNDRSLGLFEDDPVWSLDITTKDAGEEGVRPTIECPKCSAVYRGGVCRSCGYEPTTKERGGQGLEFDGTELREVTKENAKPKAAKTPQELMVAALYKAGRSNRTWGQCFGIYKHLLEENGTPNHRIPSSVEVGGHKYRMIRYGSDDSKRRVSALYPFTVGKEHGGKYMEG